MNCTHYQPTTSDGGYCAVHAKGKGVMVGAKVCRRCDQNTTKGGKTVQPGDIIASLIHTTLGFEPCGSCLKFRDWMNQLGWSGCWRERHTICTRLVEESAKKGIRVDSASIEGLVIAVIRVKLGQLTKPATEERNP